MKNMFDIMKQVKNMQEKMQTMQEELGQIEETGVSAAGMVQITLQGKGNMKAIKIDPSLLKETEKEILEDLILAAHNDAKTKLEDAVKQRTQDITKDLPLPDGFKMPF